MWLTCDPFMLRGELTLTLRFLWFGSTAGLSSGLLTEGQSMTSDLVLMNPRRRRRRHTCMSSSSQEAALQRESLLCRETAESNSAELQKQDVLCFLLEQRDKVFPQDSSFHPQSHPPHLSPRHRCILNKLKPDVSVCPSENHPDCDKKEETWSRVTGVKEELLQIQPPVNGHCLQRPSAGGGFMPPTHARDSCRFVLSVSLVTQQLHFQPLQEQTGDDV